MPRQAAIAQMEQVLAEMNASQPRPAVPVHDRYSEK
jgi:hypothetical protein